ncbi:MAG: cardiolipin synthase [Bacteroidales bacterium]
MTINDLLYHLFQTLYLISALGMIGILISENRNPVKSLAWILVILFLPFIGIIIYLFFGQDYTRQRMITRRGMKQLFIRLHAGAIGVHTDESKVTERFQGLVKLLNHHQYSPLYDGNSISHFTDGESKMESLHADLAKAKNYIYVEYYIIEDDEIGNRFAESLIEKAKEGLKVKFIYDDVGCWKVPRSFFQKMENAGIELISFLPVKFQLLTSKVNYRNHRKMVIIDGSVAYMGGMNIANRYVQGIENGIWRDTDIRIEGPAILGLQKQFLIDRYFSIKQIPNGPFHYNVPQQKGDTLIQIVGDGPFGSFHPIHRGYIKAISCARDYIYIQSPYFLPTESLLIALQTAAQSGVDVRIMLPRKGDVILAHHASRSYIREVLQAGIKVYFYNPGFLHAKMMIIDDYLSVVGSANIDFRSFEHNFELSAFIYDNQETKILKNIFLNDQKECKKITLNLWNKYPLKKRFFNSLLRLLSPLL